ncbi:MAG: sulfur carrier protein ThiS [Clostridia bacterium]|nr:sulfur carrier protein ThiS [Clostridia bacterium]
MKINGKDYDYEAQILLRLLEAVHVNCNRVVVEVDGVIVPKSDYETYLVDKGAVVEIVAFVGGG